jgi:hypothetical protein
MHMRHPARFLGAEEIQQGIDRAAHGTEARPAAAGVQSCFGREPGGTNRGGAEVAEVNAEFERC